jgi:hypothetical protein
MGEPKTFFHKINPTLYQVQLNNVKGINNLVFLESFREGWNVYIRNNSANCSTKSNYEIDQIEQPKKESDSGTKTNDFLAFCDYSFYDSWFMPNIDKYNTNDNSHWSINKHANVWRVDVNNICTNTNLCTSNEDESYNLNLVIEYSPQKYIYIGYIVLILSLVLALFQWCFFSIIARKKQL